MNLCRSRVVNYTFRPWLLEYFMSFKLSRTIITLLIPCCKFFVPYLWWKSLVSPHDGVLGYWARYSPFRIEALRNRVFALLTILRHRDCSWGLTKKQVISKNNLPVSLLSIYSHVSIFTTNNHFSFHTWFDTSAKEAVTTTPNTNWSVKIPRNFDYLWHIWSWFWSHSNIWKYIFTHHFSLSVFFHKSFCLLNKHKTLFENELQKQCVCRWLLYLTTIHTKLNKTDSMLNFMFNSTVTLFSGLAQ